MDGEQHLWFLEAIFRIFLTVAALDYLDVLSTIRGWAASTGTALVHFVAVEMADSLNFFAVNGFLRLLPFFLIGYGMQRHGLFSVTGRVAIGVVGLFLLLYVARLLTILDQWTPDQFTRRAISLAVGVLGVTFLYSARRLIEARPLARSGAFSIGVGLPIVLQKVFGNWNPVRVGVLGEKAR